MSKLDRQRLPEHREQKGKERKRMRYEIRNFFKSFEFEMDTDRLGAFFDAVIAIIMTILVLELEKPEHISWQALWDLKANFFAYILSFTWLASMWIELHYDWRYVSKTTRKSAWAMMNLLLWSSFLPYVTDLMAKNFQNSTAQIFYGLIIVAITLSKEWLYHTLTFKEDSTPQNKAYRVFRHLALQRDLITKVIFLILSIFVYPPLMSYGVLFSLIFIRILGQVRE